MLEISKFNILFVLLIALLTVSCNKNNNKVDNSKVIYNLIEPSAGIYAVVKKNVPESKTTNRYFEKNTFINDNLIKIERFDKSGKLTNDLFIPAVTKFEYNSRGNVKYLWYLDKNGIAAPHPKFHYSNIEYVYDNKERVILEIYRDENFKLLNVPKSLDGSISKKDFIAPILVYSYHGKDLLIKAFDENFNLIKETIGKKPCIPFIDCGEI